MSDEELKAAMAVLRARRKPENILKAARLGGLASKGRKLSEAHRAALSAAQRARRDRERAEAAEPPPKRPVGRPRKAPKNEAAPADTGK